MLLHDPLPLKMEFDDENYRFLADDYAAWFSAGCLFRGRLREWRRRRDGDSLGQDRADFLDPDADQSR
ncbi:hypothetical protein D3C73_1581380 [compost metagenome]